jgi:ABC-type glycerol-3-phosphate transport system substrate-binding protein
MRAGVLALTAALTVAAVLTGCGGSDGEAPASAASSSSGAEGAPKVTFIELGADSYVPCKEMQPVMLVIERTFGD